MDSVIADIKKLGIPEMWLNTEAMQSSIPFELKGWQRKVTWGPSGITGASIGCFADEFIAKGDICRSCKRDVNLIVFEKPEDIPPNTYATIQYLSDYTFMNFGICGINIPGTTLNHHPTNGNITKMKISDDELAHVASRDIQCGEELLIDYKIYEAPPAWLVDFSKKHNISMVFKGLNDFV